MRPCGLHAVAGVEPMRAAFEADGVELLVPRFIDDCVLYTCTISVTSICNE